MSIQTTTRPGAGERGSRPTAGPRVRQTTAEITARICESLPIAALTTAATGLATGAIILARRHRRP